jgi:type III restriction enzyme
MILKNYQQKALDKLTLFCKEYSKTGEIEKSFIFATNNESIQYYNVPDFYCPKICFRIPTGGGKTLLGAYSIPLITKYALQNDTACIFWLAHTDAIVEQTIKSFKNKQHPYYKHIENEFKEKTINVLTIDEALIKPFDLSTEIPIIIATIQSFSRESESGFRFYNENSIYQDFVDDSTEVPSLFNAIKKSNPIIIMDEAHNATTELRLENLAKLDPSFILELTATPDTEYKPAIKKFGTNILYSVSASQLKSENMIKLPIMVETLNNWEIVIKDSLVKRQELEDISEKELLETKRYIRPILLFKAENKRGTVTVDKILTTLQETYNIKREEIAVHIGSQKELSGIDLSDEKCKIRYIITIEALKEGWDAPFAYVLAAFGDISSSTSIEQLLGRVLRLPYTEKKNSEDLEKAYAFIASDKTNDVINSLKISLINNGFEKLEAKQNVCLSNNTNSIADEILPNLFSKPIKVPNFDIRKVPEKYREYINVDTKEETITLIKRVPAKEVSTFMKKIKEAVEINEIRENLDELIKEDESYIVKSILKDLSLPKLLIKINNNLIEFDKSIILEELNWNEKDILNNAKLSEDDFSTNIRKKLATLDINESQKIQINWLNNVKDNLFSASGIVMNFTDKHITKLVLDNLNTKNLKNIKARNLATYVNLIVLDLHKRRGYDYIDLKANLYLLIESISEKIKDTEKEIIKSKFDNLILDDSLWATSEDKLKIFSKDNYPAIPDERSEQFQKHYYKIVDKLNDEEFEFADYIDSLDEIEYWIRNIDKEPSTSFWLQTSEDKFYPDFILWLKNGAVLVVEYKGKQYKGSDDTTEKEDIGKVWGNQNENCGFEMVFKKDFKEKVTNAINKLGM